MNKQKKQTQPEPRTWQKICPYCGKQIVSLSRSQFKYNFLAHTLACKKKLNITHKEKIGKNTIEDNL